MDLSDSLISRTSDRSGVSDGVSTSESEVSDNGELEEPVQLVVNYFEGLVLFQTKMATLSIVLHLSASCVLKVLQRNGQILVTY